MSVSESESVSEFVFEFVFEGETRARSAVDVERRGIRSRGSPRGYRGLSLAPTQEVDVVLTLLDRLCASTDPPGGTVTVLPTEMASSLNASRETLTPSTLEHELEHGLALGLALDPENM